MIRAYVVCTSLLFTLSVLAQQEAVPAAATPSQNGANVITLDVVVNNKSGVPVAGLQQGDFTILDNKQPQKILLFEAVGQTAPSTGPEIVLIVDAVNTGFSQIGYERDQIAKFLQQDAGRLSHPVSIGFFADSGLTIQQAPSLDGNALVTYLNQHETGLRSIRRSQGFYGAGERMQLSLRALAELTAFEEKRPGRKIVIWLSPGWPVLSGTNGRLSVKDSQTIFNTIVFTSTQLRQAQVTLYSVDPLGTADAGSMAVSYYQQFTKGVRTPRQVEFGNIALQVLAYQSGGRVLHSSNNITEQIETCVRDASPYYVISFDPPPADGPNEYHALEVKIDRSDLKAQTRTGYYAPPAQRHEP